MINFLIPLLVCSGLSIFSFFAGRWTKREVITFEIEGSNIENGFNTIFKMEDVNLVRLTGNGKNYILEVYFYNQSSNKTIFRCPEMALQHYNALKNLMKGLK